MMHAGVRTESAARTSFASPCPLPSEFWDSHAHSYMWIWSIIDSLGRGTHAIRDEVEIFWALIYCIVWSITRTFLEPSMQTNRVTEYTMRQADGLREIVKSNCYNTYMFLQTNRLETYPGGEGRRFGLAWHAHPDRGRAHQRSLVFEPRSSFFSRTIFWAREIFEHTHVKKNQSPPSSPYSQFSPLLPLLPVFHLLPLQLINYRYQCMGFRPL